MLHRTMLVQCTMLQCSILIYAYCSAIVLHWRNSVVFIPQCCTEETVLYFGDMSGDVAPQQANLGYAAAQHGAVLYFRDSVVFMQHS